MSDHWIAHADPSAGIYPQCCHFTERVQCPKRARYHLMHPDGTPNPAGARCEEHGRRIVEQYELHLGEKWYLQPLYDFSDEDEPPETTDRSARA